MAKIETQSYKAGQKIGVLVKTGKLSLKSGLASLREIAIEKGYRDGKLYQQFIRGYGSTVC